jgi:hypothetical protein
LQTAHILPHCAFNLQASPPQTSIINRDIHTFSIATFVPVTYEPFFLLLGLSAASSSVWWHFQPFKMLALVGKMLWAWMTALVTEAQRWYGTISIPETNTTSRHPAAAFTMFRTGMSTDREPSCPLEALNMDCLGAILSASDSVTDLHAFIRASPALFNSFVAAKASILCRVVANELGPVTRDAFMMSLTDGIDMMAFGTLEQGLDIAVDVYRQVLRADSAPWIQIPDVNTAVGMARLTQVVRYFVDVYSNHRIQHIQNALNLPFQPRVISQSERRRIAQSLMRLQVMYNLHHLDFTDATKAVGFFATVVRLFESWELEQVSEIANFVSNLVASHHELDGISPDFGPDHSRKYYPNLSPFHAELMEARRRDPRHMDKVMANPRICSGKLFGSGLRIPWLDSSYRSPSEWLWWERGPSAAGLAVLDQLEQSAEAAAAEINFNGDSPMGPPWAWVHAWNGKRVIRWGNDLVPYAPSDGDWVEHSRIKDLMQSWRWLGLMFWDKDRAEELLKAELLQGCSTSWLGTYHLKAGPNAGQT